MSNKEKLKCVWLMGDPCSEDASDAPEFEIFAKQIKVPMCAHHLEQHTHIMVLAKNGYDIETILNETPEYRKQEVLVLKLSGLDVSQVDL
jgi:hypothetical protein